MTPNTKTFDEKFTSVQLGGVTIVYQCPKCYSKEDIKDEMVICDHCSKVSAEGQCSSKCEVMNTGAKVKYNVVVPYNILKEVVPASLEERITFVKLPLKGTYTFKKDSQSKIILTFLRATK